MEMAEKSPTKSPSPMRNRPRGANLSPSRSPARKKISFSPAKIDLNLRPDFDASFSRNPPASRLANTILQTMPTTANNYNYNPSSASASTPYSPTHFTSDYKGKRHFKETQQKESHLSENPFNFDSENIDKSNITTSGSKRDGDNEIDMASKEKEYLSSPTATLGFLNGGDNEEGKSPIIRSGKRHPRVAE